MIPMLTVLYVLSVFASLLPFTWLTKMYLGKINLKGVVEELAEVGERLKRIAPDKEKKVRVLRARYKKLKGTLNRVFLFNLVFIWMGIFVALSVSRGVTYYVAVATGLPLPPSPLNIPGISVDGKLNDLLIFLAAVLAYQPLHNKISGLHFLTSAWE